ncbi:MAG: hypothetical protein MST12_06040 [Spirochaetia bacterium]|nr:hypothetical protein [Spirochaetia bacterium]
MKNFLKYVFVLLFCSIAILPFFSCSSSVGVSDDYEQKTGSIRGVACYSNSSDSSGINIILEKSDGLTTRSIDSDVRSITSVISTAADGRYEISDVVEGIYTLYATSNSSSEKALKVNVVVRSGESVEVEKLRLTATGSLKGKITLDNSENSNYGFIIYVAGTSYSAMTDMDGEFEITGIPAGTGYSIIISKGSFTYYWKSGIEVKALVSESVGKINFSENEIDESYKGNGGTDGKDGIPIVWKGSHASEKELGTPQNLWAYYNTTDGCSYIFDGAKWCLLASKGLSGTDGTSIVWKGSYAESDEIENPENLWAYYNTTDGCSYVFDGTKWCLLASKGVSGTDGTSIVWKGSYAGPDEIENPEYLWAYYNTTDGCSYIYTDLNWTLLAKGNLKADNENNGFESNNASVGNGFSLLRYGIDGDNDIYEFIYDDDYNLCHSIRFNFYTDSYLHISSAYTTMDRMDTSSLPGVDWAGTEYDDLINREIGVLKTFDNKGNLVKVVKHNGICAYQEIFYTDRKLTKDITYYSDGSIKSLSEYNSNGDLLKGIAYNTDGCVSSSRICEYFSDGNVIKYIYYKSDGSIEDSYSYTYDSNGNVVKYIYYYSDGSIDHLRSFSYSNEYDSNGKTIKAIRYNGYGEIDCSIAYEYDSYGNIVRYTQYDPDGSIWASYSYSYEYDSEGNILKKTYYSDGNITWSYEYDSNGKVIKYVDYRRDGSISSSYSYTHDSNGYRIEKIETISDGSVDESKSYLHIFDVNGLLTSDDNYSYVYYKNGAVKQIVRNSDSSVIWNFYY